jgi:hypothetical protein
MLNWTRAQMNLLTVVVLRDWWYGVVFPAVCTISKAKSAVQGAGLCHLLFLVSLACLRSGSLPRVYWQPVRWCCHDMSVIVGNKAGLECHCGQIRLKPCYCTFQLIPFLRGDSLEAFWPSDRGGQDSTCLTAYVSEISMGSASIHLHF